MIVKCLLIAKEDDLLGYQTLVFKNLDKPCPFGYSYIMTVVFPNWQSYIPEMNDTGYLEYECVKAGDEYYDYKLDKTMKYNYSNNVFIKFVKEKDNSIKDIII